MAYADRPTHRPYARIERERRFLLERLPTAVDPNDYQRFRDLYVAGTTLRLRQVEHPDGRWIATKLGQKRPNPDSPEDPRERQMTTLYLEEAELLALSGLVGLRTQKRRYFLPEQGWTFAIDVWEAPASAAGLVLGEVEAPTLTALEAITCPSWALKEVTEDPSYSAFALAGRAG